MSNGASAMNLLNGLPVIPQNAAAGHAHALIAANFLAELDDNECRAWIAALLALRSLSRRRNARGEERVRAEA
jgi:hypothetical protein